MSVPHQAEPGAFPLHRFEEFEPLTSSELDAIGRLAASPQFARKGSVIRSEGAGVRSFFLLIEGWVAASHSVPDGGRQILKIHLPGDALGTPSMSMARAAEELRALTEVTYAEVPLTKFGTLFETHPRAAARFMLSIQLERVALMDRLASIGRTTALARVAAFIIDVAERLEPLGRVEAGSFDLPLTQEQLADVAGLTAVHVNRMLRELTDHDLIRRSGTRMSIIDPKRLAAVASRTRRPRATELSWLPQAS